MKKYIAQMGDLKWIDLIGPKKTDLNELSAELNIPKRILGNALNPEHLPKYDDLGETTVIYLRTIDPSGNPQAVNIQDLTTKITLIIKNNVLITIHRLDKSYLEELRTRSTTENLSMKEIIKTIVSSALLAFDQHLADLESRVDKFETEVFQLQKNHHILKEGYALKRRASAFRKVLKFSLNILGSLEGRPEFIWRDFVGLGEAIERNLFYSEDLLENVTGLINLHISLLSHTTNEASYRTNEVMRVLTVFSIFFLPLNFLAGIYGMNFKYMPELEMHNGYFVVLGGMAAISFFIFAWVYKRGWLKKN